MSNTLPPGVHVRPRWTLGAWLARLRGTLIHDQQQEQATAHRRAVGARNLDDVLGGVQQAAHDLEESVALLRQERAEDRARVDDQARRLVALETRVSALEDRHG